MNFSEPNEILLQHFLKVAFVGHHLDEVVGQLEASEGKYLVKRLQFKNLNILTQYLSAPGLALLPVCAGAEVQPGSDPLPTLQRSSPPEEPPRPSKCHLHQPEITQVTVALVLTN